MEADGLVPYVIDNEPPTQLSVVYEGQIALNYGIELTPTQVKDEPKVTWLADPNKYYLLVMVDPDAPSRAEPIFGQVNHWLIGNIPGNNLRSSEANLIIEYRGSGPPKGSGLHRYIFLLYEQPGKLTFDEPRSTKLSRANRLKFSIRNFAKKYNLASPIAGNYFQAQWDPYVDERNKNVTDD